MIYDQGHINQHHFLRFRATELNEIYAVMSIRSFIISLISIFVPIYLYTLSHSVKTVIVLYLLMFLFEAAFEYPSALFLATFGPKHNIALSLPILVFHFWQLWTIPTYHWPIWTISLTGAMTLALFWQGYNFDFSRSKSKKGCTKQVSRMYIIITILGATAPFIGGLIASHFGLNALFGVVTVLLLFAVVPLFIGGEVHLRRQFNPLKLRRRKLARQVISYAATGMEASTNANFWPLLVFFLVANYQEIGLVTSLALLLTILVTYIVGKTADQRGKVTYIRFGSVLTGTIYFVKAFVNSIYQVFGLNLLTSISHSFFTSPLMTEYYLHADEEYRNEYIFLMEISTDLGRVAFFGIIYAVSFYLSDRNLLVFCLILGGLASFLISLMPDYRAEITHGNRKIKVTPAIRKAKVEVN